ncbi:MAG: helix-turn-helix domain-containing protein [Verrucomicrobiota bacterium]
MVTEKIKELAILKEKAAKLEVKVIAERAAELAALPEAYGYDSLKAFIKALKQSAGGKRGRKKGTKGKVGRPKRRKRAKVTPEIKAQVKAAVEAGKSGAAIAKEFGVSVQTVQNIKKAFGLVKSRS